MPRDLIQGAIAGAAAWMAMDRVLQFLYDHEDPQVRERENDARGGVPALEVAAEKVAWVAGIALSDEQRQQGGTVLQWVTGIGAGLAYGALRNRFPGATAGRGLAFGAAFSLLVDEGMIPLLGFAPGPGAFPWETHARGFAGHLVFGVVAETALEWLDRVG